MRPLSRLTRAWAALLFLALVAEAFWLSPPARPNQGAWVMTLLMGPWTDQEPTVVALFQLMGIWPMALAALLAPHLRRRPVPLWPFALGSMAVGAFSLLPGLALGGSPRPMAWWQHGLGGRWLSVALLVPTVGLVSWGLLAGSTTSFVHLWQTDQLVHIMTLDFAALWITSVLVARDEGGRWWLTVLPLVGTMLYRLTRPAR